ncbi:hypothetical protein [Andreprevotia chitinilytica]|uniref:hypothetical protein n=1 Tax=Andreprevotia chitinilytica TaxID=396808 RepID=UPI0005566770|nr:hypothetical protein [Andreprevotia chitinilytica]
MRLLLLPVLLLIPALSQAGPFCPWKLPGDAKSERYLNLTVVQYIELTDSELHLTYGGGNLGSGHDARIPVKSRDEAQKLLQDMRDTAKHCDQPAPAAPPLAAR